MPTKDGFNQDHPLHVFLADEPEEQDVEKAWDRAVFSSATKDGFNLLLLLLSEGPEQQRIGKAWDRTVISSPTKVGHNQDHPLPLVLIDEVEQQGIGKAWDGAVISSRVRKASIWGATATAIFVAILWVENPATLFADLTVSLVDKSALQPDTNQWTPTIQSTADAQALPPTTKDAPTRDEMAAAIEPADENQTENSQPPSDALFALDKDAQARAGPVQPVQDAPGQVAQNAPAPVTANARASLRPMQEDRHVRPVHHARAEIRPVQNPRKKVRHEQTARAEVPPAQDAQDQPMQNFLQKIFGRRN
jgi:hypothetical protein